MNMTEELLAIEISLENIDVKNFYHENLLMKSMEVSSQLKHVFAFADVTSV